ncbi:hypothetical protein WA026_015960 [Henosepilachna vigintioctopunctata]|uniref:S1 motif domain-containing protein n=1 Tax=Henosepilachna vigintioctopunctata TaxID=420089 RepID=A0AAW1U370_9CUCU
MLFLSLNSDLFSSNDQKPLQRHYSISFCGSSLDVARFPSSWLKRKYESTAAKSSKKLKSVAEDVLYDTEPVWQNFELLSQENSIQPDTAQSLIKLFEDGNTIPFIARYRRNVIGNMSPEELRLVKDHYEEICCLRSKLKTVVKTIQKNGLLNNDLRKSLSSVRTAEELELLYAPFKPESKRTLSERAKALGLDKPAYNILNDICEEYLENYIQSNKDGLKTLGEVEKGIINIIASVIGSDTEILSHVRELRTSHYFFIETKKLNIKGRTLTKKDVNNKPVDESKYRLYYDFKITSDNIKPHQVLAINRGENQKVLSVKIEVPEFLIKNFKNFCMKKFLNTSSNKQKQRIVKEAINDSYTRLVQPLLIRELRSTLKGMAEKTSIETFSKNLKQLLLAQPIKGKLILGLDPGFANGCKLALIDETGTLLDHNTIYPFKTFKNAKSDSEYTLKKMLHQHKCELIALGNGTACRETETWLSELIGANVFSPLKLTYTIVNEDGASIYSCSPEAKKEFPKLDPHIISAVSLARRVQEPLAELVKIEPQHLGVGMYQHDLRKKQLNEALNEVVSECVSFVGVDLNTASQCLLKGVAGLSDKKASQIINYREENGPFIHRRELLKVKGIGEKVFQQCSGFLRIGPINLEEEAIFYKKSNTTKLDRTIIHPESYDMTKTLMKELNLKEKDIGSREFIEKIKNVSKNLDIDELSRKYDTNKDSVKLILDTLGKSLNYDLRLEYNITPLFKKGIKSIEDLKIGNVLSGRISNVTSFGCFVDIGVHFNGLIHLSKLKGKQLQIGDRVEVEVLSIELDRKRISLKYVGMSV